MPRLWSAALVPLAVFGHVESGPRQRRAPARPGSRGVEPAVLAAAADEPARAAFGFARGERLAPEGELLRQCLARRQPVLASCALPVVAHALLREGGDRARERDGR